MQRRSVLLLLGAALPVSGCISITDGEALDESGTIDIVIDGEALDLSQDRFQAEHAEEASLAFHLHESDDRWYMEGEERVTVARALDLLPHITFSVEAAGNVMTIDDRTYDEQEAETAIEIRVDGTGVDPDEYLLQDGDVIRVEISTSG